MTPSNPHCTVQHEERLGSLAMEFRSTRDEHERALIAVEYAESVRRLIESRNWREMPPPEDQLSDDSMPREFFDFWLNPPESPSLRGARTA